MVQQFRLCYLFFSDPSIVHGGLIIGLEARVSSIEAKMSDLDARGSEESDNLANERNLDRFIMSGKSIFFGINPV